MLNLQKLVENKVLDSSEKFVHEHVDNDSRLYFCLHYDKNEPKEEDKEFRETVLNTLNGICAELDESGEESNKVAIQCFIHTLNFLETILSEEGSPYETLDCLVHIQDKEVDIPTIGKRTVRHVIHYTVIGWIPTKDEDGMYIIQTLFSGHIPLGRIGLCDLGDVGPTFQGRIISSLRS